MRRLTWRRDEQGPEPVPPPGSSLAAWQWLLRLAVFALPLGSVAAARGAVAGAFVVIVVITAAVSAVVPDSPAALVVVVLVGGLWAIQADVDVTVWTLLAAWSLGAFHVVTAFAALLPVGAGWDGEVAARWLRRLGVVLAATAAMWAMAYAVSRVGPTSNGALLAAGLAAAIALAGVLHRRSIG